ncbi:MAG: LysR family transcriptional regulator [Oscillospiraceae bacterium]|nr:LysR family transcriptional regulator [Oscillospiraceae bacterium]
MTLQQLEYFVAACRYGNISRAAEDFDVSQPSISVAIKNLENEFGVQLIRRRQTGFTMTSDGEIMLKMAQSLLAHASGVSSTMQARGHSRNLVRLGMPPMASAILFPTIYSASASALPRPRSSPGRQAAMSC